MVETDKEMKLVEMLKALKRANKTKKFLKEQQWTTKLADIYKFMQEIDEHHIYFHMDFEPSLFRHSDLYIKNKGKNMFVSLSIIGDHLSISLGNFTSLLWHDCDIKVLDMILNHIKSPDFINELINRERDQINKKDLRE